MATPPGSTPSLLELEAARQRRSARRGRGSGRGPGSGRAPRAGGKRGSRRSAGEVWFARIGSLLALAAAAWFVATLQRDVRAGRYGRIETDRLRLDTGPGWFDPRWELELAHALAALGPLDPDDRGAIDALGGVVASLSFVRAVSRPSVIWPDGLRLELELREPVACVVAPTGRQYATLAVDGTVLSGRWSAPPDRASGFLPLLWSSRPLFLEPGQRVDDAAVVDGLAVAAALWRELPPAALARLGRVVIDARRSRITSPDEPGTRILLEDGREVVFGRSPNLDAPGETPVDLKLQSLVLALDPGTAPWVLVDVRWDRPEILVTSALEEGLPEAEEGLEPGGSGAR